MLEVYCVELSIEYEGLWPLALSLNLDYSMIYWGEVRSLKVWLMEGRLDLLFFVCFLRGFNKDGSSTRGPEETEGSIPN